eukprot:13749978-Ditylum_brightwellii.AAC.1
MFQRSDESVDTYSTRFLHAKRKLTCNNTAFNDKKLCEVFILSLGSEFTSFHNNMSSLPDGLETTNIKQLTTLAR